MTANRYLPMNASAWRDDPCPNCAGTTIVPTWTTRNGTRSRTCNLCWDFEAELSTGRYLTWAIVTVPKPQCLGELLTSLVHIWARTSFGRLACIGCGVRAL